MSEVQQQRIHDLLAGHTVSQAMSRNCATAPASLTLQELIDRHFLGAGLRCLVLTEGEQPVGLLTLHGIRGVPQERWGVVTAAQAMVPLAQTKTVRPNQQMLEAMEEMDRDGVNQLPVMDGGALLGVLSREDVISYLRTLRELGL